ncbi:MAG: ribbon-helix-helix protein, CopG family [Candidatus Devosia phytovorans]|uniref:Ribbon-helix-helix protein, CopG family n=1 Tax=Candidatus Devosia phytovorans TaxID=3121372 RepID=A0AAJ5VXV4_9HYPH|nr:ribbon-helix-helix protein, CopG family [Devosia sp.]WEK06402.1 MAG: ribbon-helix-helix protein, CopG family [Devosia sp.]
MSKPDLSDPITLRLPVDVLAEIERIAAASDRTRSWIMVRAMRLYIAREGKDVLAIAEGIAQLERGEGEDAEVVLAELEAIVRGDAA